MALPLRKPEFMQKGRRCVRLPVGGVHTVNKAAKLSRAVAGISNISNISKGNTKIFWIYFTQLHV